MCQLPVDNLKQDCAQLNGSCSHLLHLRCWQEKGCCSRPSGTVDMEGDIKDPLRVLQVLDEEDVDDPAVVQQGTNPIRRLFSTLSRVLDASVDANGTSLARRKVPVGELTCNGYNANTLIKEDPDIVSVLILEGGYSSPQLKQLGFRWDLLIRGGMSERTFPKFYGELGSSFIETFVVDLSSLLTLCSWDITQVPSLGISSADLGRKVSAAELFTAKMDARIMTAFHFTIEQWKEDLCLTSHLLKSFTTGDLRQVVRGDAQEKVAFDHFFPDVVFSLVDVLPEVEAPVEPAPLIDTDRIRALGWKRPMNSRPGLSGTRHMPP